MKMRNNLQINFINSSGQEKLTSLSREEIKEAVIDKIDSTFAPNFMQEEKVAPDYRRWIPQDSFNKGWLATNAN